MVCVVSKAGKVYAVPETGAELFYFRVVHRGGGRAEYAGHVIDGGRSVRANIPIFVYDRWADRQAIKKELEGAVRGARRGGKLHRVSYSLQSVVSISGL
ncbi:MAG TPA: hypothetical protein VJK51_04320 [Candidatus Nanoarchaeia archaeon]|nr:hypothetical protein [Candidatus Nanoarchaeia archaeon]